MKHIVSRGLFTISFSPATTRTPDGLLYLGTVGVGVARWDGSTVKVFAERDGLTDPFVLALGEDAQGFLLVGTACQGLFRATAERFARVTGANGMDAQRIQCIQLDEEGRCWVGTEKGLYADLGDGDFLHIEGVTHGVNRATCNGDTLWAATSEGLYILPTRRLPWRLHKQSQLPDVSLTCITRDSPGNLWIGSGSHGLYRLHASHVDSFGVHDGLASNAVEQVLLDALENVWVGTRRGIDMLELDVLQERATQPASQDTAPVPVPAALTAHVETLLTNADKKARKSAADAIAEFEPASDVPTFARNIATLERQTPCPGNLAVDEKIAADGDTRALPALDLLGKTPRKGCPDGDCLECLREPLARTIRDLGK